MVKEPKIFDPNVLLELASKGDEIAFTKLYDIYSTDLTKHILSKVSDLDIAQDILHDLFLSLWKNRSHLSEIFSFPAYLYSSCRYLILDHFRKELKRGLQLSNVDIDILDDTVSLEDRLHYRYIIDMVENEIENLPEKCQIVFKMSRFDYRSNKEIANELGISESTVEKHINKAISRLRLITKRFLFLF